MTLILDSIDPAQLVSCNVSLHHHKRSKVRGYWRELAWAEARSQRIPAVTERVRIVVTFRWPDQKLRDVGNFYPYVAKGLVDGLVDANVLAFGDDDAWLVGPDLRRDLEPGPHRICIDIEPIPGRDDA